MAFLTHEVHIFFSLIEQYVAALKFTPFVIISADIGPLCIPPVRIHPTRIHSTLPFHLKIDFLLGLRLLLFRAFSLLLLRSGFLTTRIHSTIDRRSWASSSTRINAARDLSILRIMIRMGTVSQFQSAAFFIATSRK